MHERNAHNFPLDLVPLISLDDQRARFST